MLNFRLLRNTICLILYPESDFLQLFCMKLLLSSYYFLACVNSWLVSLTGKQRSFNPSAYVDHRLHELIVTLLDKHYRIRLLTKDALNSCKVSFEITPLEGDNKTPTTVDIETSYQRGDWVFVSVSSQSTFSSNHHYVVPILYCLSGYVSVSSSLSVYEICYDHSFHLCP
jgi:hypothetical protein